MGKSTLFQKIYIFTYQYQCARLRNVSFLTKFFNFRHEFICLTDTCNKNLKVFVFTKLPAQEVIKIKGQYLLMWYMF